MLNVTVTEFQHQEHVAYAIRHRGDLWGYVIRAGRRWVAYGYEESTGRVEMLRGCRTRWGAGRAVAEWQEAEWWAPDYSESLAARSAR